MLHNNNRSTTDIHLDLGTKATLWTDNWKFKLYHEAVENIFTVPFGSIETDSTWQDVELPHDWLISDTKNLYKTGVGVYKKTFSLSIPSSAHSLTCAQSSSCCLQAIAQDGACGKNYFLRFDGIYMDSTLYVNGQEVAQWKNGYTAFTQDITSFVHSGENEVVVCVNYQSPNSRWYSGAGIYRDCWLIEKGETYFPLDAVYVTPHKLDAETWQVDVDAEIVGVADSIGYRLLEIGADSTDVFEGAHATTPAIASASFKFDITSPKLWDIITPTNYILELTLYQNGKVCDITHTRFGFREISYSATDGFYLNGRRVSIKGVCQHHDLGALGAAVHKDALRRQLEILRGMGVNAIRTAHNPPAAVLMQLADEMGFLVMSEFADVWRRSKTKYDYARFFDDWAARDIASWIRRDRNCPSIIMWSIGNEIYDTHADFEDGAKTMQFLMDEVTKHDPKMHAPPTLSSNYMPWENTQKCADIIKLIGYNYAEYLYHDHHKKNPSWIIYGGETASIVQSRGIYHFPLKCSLLADDDLQCSAIGNSAVSWGAKSTEVNITNHRDATFNMGQFLWTGTDYIGEPTPYHTKNSYFGQVDTAGFPKDSYYIYKSAWTNVKEEPFVHLYPYWDWSEGQPVDVRIASNASRVELFLNGESLGAKDIDHEKGLKLTADYIVPYAPGCITAVAYDTSGGVIAKCERHSFSDAVALELAYTKWSIGGLTFVEITAVDANGNTVENATNRVTVTVLGGKLIGLDNGDSTDYDQYQNNNSRRLFSGKLLAIVSGYMPQVVAEIDWTDVPIRKIELQQNDDIITAKIHPQNATYSDIEWRLANEAGIDSPLGRLDVIPELEEAHENISELESACMCLSEYGVKLSPKGDGTVYVRASTKNGKPHPSLISLLPIEITGYGTTFLDPYTFISGGLYNRSSHPMDNGNERGIATARDRQSQVGFANLDFGKFGTDEFTIWLFPLVVEPFPIDIWLGMPGDKGARKLTTVTYDKGSIWNTYQPVTYTLPERLTGVQTLCFVVNIKVHIKGFQFKSKAAYRLPFGANDSIYGDNFTTKGNAVESIGNNVTISFDNMIFDSQAKACGIALCWRTKQDKTSVKLVFTSESGAEIVNMISVPAQDEYASAKFLLDAPLEGGGRLDFIFLPGTDIDLEWFEF